MDYASSDRSDWKDYPIAEAGYESDTGDRNIPTLGDFGNRSQVAMVYPRKNGKKVLNRRGGAVCRIMAGIGWSIPSIAYIFHVSDGPVTKAVNNTHPKWPRALLSEDLKRAEPEFQGRFPLPPSDERLLQLTEPQLRKPKVKKPEGVVEVTDSSDEGDSEIPDHQADLGLAPARVTATAIYCFINAMLCSGVMLEHASMEQSREAVNGRLRLTVYGQTRTVPVPYKIVPHRLTARVRNRIYGPCLRNFTARLQALGGLLPRWVYVQRTPSPTRRIHTVESKAQTRRGGDWIIGYSLTLSDASLLQLEAAAEARKKNKVGEPESVPPQASRPVTFSPRTLISLFKGRFSGQGALDGKRTKKASISSKLRSFLCIDAFLFQAKRASRANAQNKDVELRTTPQAGHVVCSYHRLKDEDPDERPKKKKALHQSPPFALSMHTEKLDQLRAQFMERRGNRTHFFFQSQTQGTTSRSSIPDSQTHGSTDSTVASKLSSRAPVPQVQIFRLAGLCSSFFDEPEPTLAAFLKTVTNDMDLTPYQALLNAQGLTVSAIKTLATWTPGENRTNSVTPAWIYSNFSICRSRARAEGGGEVSLLGPPRASATMCLFLSDIMAFDLTSHAALLEAQGFSLNQLKTMLSWDPTKLWRRLKMMLLDPAQMGKNYKGKSYVPESGPKGMSAVEVLALELCLRRAVQERKKGGARAGPHGILTKVTSMLCDHVYFF
ncbi:hypothetical protein C8R45DRAFT_935245 [Mycena sanguinolenta]|nr:hypothetical protein C8R45DRAFT_935245 [Mycena sanguinolenta]